MYNPNLTFGSIPTTCFRSERPAFFHNGVVPEEHDVPLEGFLRKLTSIVRNDRFTFIHNGRPIMAHPKWVRDHIGEMKAFKHWEHDLKQYLEFIVLHQHPDGFFYEMVQVPSDMHVDMIDDTCRLYDKENDLYFIRLEIEADIEYLMVEGACLVYQATGDEAWIRRMLPALERGITYMITNPKRWDKKHGLVKRPFTIDTWDFVDGQDTINRMIVNEEEMSIMHGDNTGIYDAMKRLAWLNRRFGYSNKAADWEEKAEAIKVNLNRYCWNGRFYQHMLHLGKNGPDNSEERERMSLSCSYDMNRGIMTEEQIQASLQEYQKRSKTSGCFAEWFSVNPPYEGFGGVNRMEHPKNIYVNGGLSSLVAGELAKAALCHGHEKYGWDVLQRIMSCVERDGNLHFLYHPETGANLGGGPSGWSAAAIVAAIEEGLAGIVDADILFRKLELSPRWAATGIKQVKYITGYEVSETFVSTACEYHDDGIGMVISAPSEYIRFHVLLPHGVSSIKTVAIDGEQVQAQCEKINDSIYVNFEWSKVPVASTVTGYYPEQASHNIEICF